MSSHIIHKQQVCLNVSRLEAAFELQNVVSALFREELTDRLNVIFDGIASQNEVLRFDALRLNLGTIATDNFEKEFAQRLLRQIEGEIIKAKKEGPHNGCETTQQTTLTTSRSLRDSLVYFLQFGALPWYEKSRKIDEWEAEIMSRFSKADWKNVIEWIQKTAVANDVITERLVQQFSDDFLRQIVLFQSSINSRSLAQILNDIQYLLAAFAGRTRSQARKEIYVEILQQHLLKKENCFETILVVKLFIYKLSSNQLEALYMAKHRLHSTLQSNEATATLDKLFETVEKHKALRKALDIKSVGNLLLLSAAPPLGNDDLNGFEESTAKGVIKAVEKNKNPKPVAPEDEVYVSNCGTVLLHPFLLKYFSELGLLENKIFLNDQLHGRAVLLLYYLATGVYQAPEFDLTLQKIICGFPLEETLPSQIELTEKEREESLSLLKSVTDYWPPLKNTSADGLRGSFLQRDGKLTRKDSGWFLIIEQKTIDFLLGKLPWGFSTIRLPWMKDVLSVEWC